MADSCASRNPLALLRDILLATGAGPIQESVRARPTSRYSRLLGFYYEFTTGLTLDPALEIGGNYVDALPAEDYFVALRPARNRRWRVWDNLLGERHN